jgi:BTB/POZ domain
MTSAEDKILAKRISLINNKDASPDVTFLVGSERIEIAAHKINLTTASEVFEAMLSKMFQTEGETKIVVEDIEADPFLQVRK